MILLAILLAILSKRIEEELSIVISSTLRTDNNFLSFYYIIQNYRSINPFIKKILLINNFLFLCINIYREREGELEYFYNIHFLFKYLNSGS